MPALPTVRSLRKGLFYKVLLVPVERIELPTFGLQNRCSTAELNRQAKQLHVFTKVTLPPFTAGVHIGVHARQGRGSPVPCAAPWGQ
jgi:hypothetical protein